jgi:hypothetical protein
VNPTSWHKCRTVIAQALRGVESQNASPVEAAAAPAT